MFLLEEINSNHSKLNAVLFKVNCIKYKQLIYNLNLLITTIIQLHLCEASVGFSY